MKNIFKIFAGVAISALFVTSCNVENVKDSYTPVQSNEASFAQANVINTEIDAKATTYPVIISRNSAKDALSVGIDVSKLPVGITAPATVNFAAGEYSATLSLNISAMEIGNQYKGSISLKDTTQYNKNIAISSCAITLAKAYTWVSLGKGQFCEAFWEGFFSECEVLKADGFERYRFIDPYNASAESVKKPSYVEIWTLNEDGNVKWNTFNTGFDYSGSGDYVKAYWPSDLSASYAAKEAYSGFWEKDIIVLFPCFYIDGLGGWASSMYPIAFCLPGRTQASFQKWLEDNGIW